MVGIVPIVDGDLPPTDITYPWFQNPASLANGLAPNIWAIKVEDSAKYSQWYLGVVLQQWDAIRSSKGHEKWRAIKRSGKLLALTDKRYGTLLKTELKRLPSGKTIARIIPEEITLNERSTVAREIDKIFKPKSPIELRQLTAAFYYDLYMHLASSNAPSAKARFAWEDAAVERIQAVRWPL